MSTADSPANVWSVHALTQGDSTQWLALRDALWPGHTQEALRGEMDDIVSRFGRDTMVYLAKTEKWIVGFIELSIRDSAPGCSGGRIGFIEGVYVDAEYRGLGVARALIKAGESWARAQGCLEMASDTDARYPLSPLLHQRLGYAQSEQPLHFCKRL